MTYCVPDNTPDTWHKISFSSEYLHKVDTYIGEHKVNAKISGAISFGSCGPASSLISFELEEDGENFKRWFAQNQTQPLTGGIYISRNFK